MKSFREKKQDKALKEVKTIWKALKIESVVKKYGVPAARHAMTKWVEYQRKNSALLKKKSELESELAEISGKL
jgi:hypothetical protein